MLKITNEGVMLSAHAMMSKRASLLRAVEVQGGAWALR
jgi:hypothetical protein